MRIVLCTNYFYPHVGGAEIVSHAIATEFAKYHQVYVLTRAVHGRKIGESQTGPVVIEYSNMADDVFMDRLRSLRPDVVFVYSDVFDFYRTLLVAPASYKLVVATCGANWVFSSDSKRRIFEGNQKKITKFICHSKHERDYALLHESKISDRLEIIPNGVYLDEFNENQVHRIDLFGPEKEQRVWLLNVANFFPYKGQLEMVKVVKELGLRHDNLHYIQLASQACPGLGPQLQAEWLKKVKEQLGKSSNVATSLVQVNDRDTVIGLFRNSNVYVCTSLKEVAPITHLEAMAADRPWVSSNVGNVRDLTGGSIIEGLKDRDFRFVFDSEAVKMFADAIDYQLYQRESGRKQIETELNWNRILPRYTKLVESL
jgi:glycosyltransferase involved in cell wall biosynthesis